MLLIFPTAGTSASIVNSAAPCFFTASLILRPVIGLVSVTFVPTSNKASAALRSSNVTVHRWVPCTRRSACTPLICPYRALLSILFVPMTRRMNFWNTYRSSLVQRDVMRPANAPGPCFSFRLMQVSATYSSASSHVAGTSSSVPAHERLGDAIRMRADVIAEKSARAQIAVCCGPPHIRN